jgi:tetratricopeptide (TPR) repeat protein
MPPESFKATLRGFLQVFPDATLWAGCLDAHRPVAMLLGVRGEKVSDTFSVAGLAGRIRAARLTGAELAPLGLDSPEGVLSHFLAGAEELRALAGAGPASTDDLPLAEVLARARGPQAEPWGLQNLRLLVAAWRLRLATVPGADAESLARLTARREARRSLARAGLAAQAGDELRGALPMLRSARELSPADPEIGFALWSLLADLGAQAVRAGRAAQARELLEEALSVGPLRDYLAHDLALALTALGETDQALERARQAASLGPREPLNWELLEKVAYNARQMEESRKAGARAAELRKLRGLAPQPP